MVAGPWRAEFVRQPVGQDAIVVLKSRLRAGSVGARHLHEKRRDDQHAHRREGERHHAAGEVRQDRMGRLPIALLTRMPFGVVSDASVSCCL